VTLNNNPSSKLYYNCDAKIIVFTRHNVIINSQDIKSRQFNIFNIHFVPLECYSLFLFSIILISVVQNKQRRERERRQQQAQASMQVLSKTQKSRERSSYY